MDEVGAFEVNGRHFDTVEEAQAFEKELDLVDGLSTAMQDVLVQVKDQKLKAAVSKALGALLS